jgi:hypothetical protein
MRSPLLAGLWTAGRLHWRHFVWAWLFPILLYMTFVAESLLGPIQFKYSGWILFGEIVALVLAGIFSSAPYRRQKVSKGSTFFWILLVPVLLFIFLSMLPFRFPVTITEVPTSQKMGLEMREPAAQQCQDTVNTGRKTTHQGGRVNYPPCIQQYQFGKCEQLPNDWRRWSPHPWLL